MSPHEGNSQVSEKFVFGVVIDELFYQEVDANVGDSKDEGDYSNVVDVSEEGVVLVVELVLGW